ncbi:LLM class flavin-dependent oxidoreductase [Candidatus Bathyarchaeota archaeon]|jgi:alkanesulfonate monooxygenase SsuD/methylene tetrahydromethanopterin reductase-like flavin-dependent oxidoreductase (luciferase family)|nr:LLM class flavin-dependent oxidoreductase [Candidatus Bathyarchaeota archaeon]MBT4320349.1 LLM class flavin-dependent oxidoreductase [Candidatus Bathyarchaeota archaeon]MBT4424412.1 LLM class flavin-dependent oxidoreductase [Candidatus Bathyarchaeota archaeon]MBT5643493.1 LLM class flavin-dependent oxidoreductase [Candidatus Bathyarchaeota archaeon]MBT6605537.1 LLM class flavin-dependent oxidoreductase [Candidatus Bathyarchaeota archaeon]
MKYAINVPNFGDYHHPDTVAELAADAEDAGWDGFFTWDHLQWDGPMGDTAVNLATVATMTRRIKIGPMVCPLPRRRPWKVAMEAISLDHLSKGRFILGVGLGAPPEEYTKFGEDANARLRADKLDESLNIIKGLWSGETFSFRGKHYQLDEVTYGKPYQEEIPIWVAGFLPSTRPLYRAARYDGVSPGRNWPEAFTVEDLGKVIRIIEKRRGSMDNYDIVVSGESPGDPEKGAETLAPWIDVGATWWSENINTWRGSVEEMRDRVEAGPPRA